VTTEEEKAESKAKVAEMVQSIMTQFVNSGIGAEGSAFVLGVCLSAVLSLLRKVTPEEPEKEQFDQILEIFSKGLKAQTVPILTSLGPKTPPPQH
jgi:hypothetical protein